MNTTQRFLSGLGATALLLTTAAATIPAAHAATLADKAPGSSTVITQEATNSTRDYINTIGVRNSFNVPITVECQNRASYSFTLQPGQRLWNHWRQKGESHPKVLTFTTKSGATLGTLTAKGRYVNDAGKEVSGTHVTWKGSDTMRAKQTTTSTRFTGLLTVLDVDVLPVRQYQDHDDYPIELVLSPGSQY